MLDRGYARRKSALMLDVIVWENLSLSLLDYFANQQC